MTGPRICRRLQVALLLLALVAVPGAGRDDGPVFRDIAREVGLVFKHENGMVGDLWAVEHLGAGVALLDFDNDGDLDIYLGQGGPLEPGAGRDRPADRLFINRLEEGTLRFEDVSSESGLGVATGYAQGVATGDYDGDGAVDLYITNWGANQLLRNDGSGHFVDVTESAGAGDPRWSVAATFFDYDGDGDLDLFVGNYNDFRAATHRECYMPQGSRDYCGPLAYAAEPDRLLRNLGGGTFEDTTRRAGLAGEAATALGAVAADFNDDGHLDLYVANDLMPNQLWLNRGDGSFVDDALLMGAAVDGNGKPQASMGVVAEDLDGDGLVDLFMSHLARETNTLYRNTGEGMFVDASQSSRLGAPSFSFTGFGTAALDFDGDGWLDLYVANGAVHRVPEQLAAGESLPLRQRNQLFRGLGDGTFEEVERALHPGTAEVSRGLAVGDIDNDGDSDLVVTNNGGPARLLLNQRVPGTRWLGLRVRARSQGPDVYGARVGLLPAGSADTPGQPMQWRRVHTDGSYASASDPRVLFALPTPVARSVVVHWPSGGRERFLGLQPGRYHELIRSAGEPVRDSPGPDL